MPNWAICEYRLLSDFSRIDIKDMDETMILVKENNCRDDGRVGVHKFKLVC